MDSFSLEFFRPFSSSSSQKLFPSRFRNLLVGLSFKIHACVFEHTKCVCIQKEEQYIGGSSCGCKGPPVR